MITSEKQITILLKFSCDVESLWEAISDPNVMRLWFFDNIASFEPNLGYETKFIVENEGKVFTHNWKVSKVEYEKALSYKWFYSEYPGMAEAHYLISKDNDCCVLNFSFDILEDFPGDVTEFRRESCLEGWNYFLKKRLVDFLNNQPND